MSELKTPVPKEMIDDCCLEFPGASLRLVVLVAVGGLNQEHPWFPYAIKIAVHVARCIARRVPTDPDRKMVVSVPMVLLMLNELGILNDIESFTAGFVVHQNQRWLDAHRSELEDPALPLAIAPFDTEVALWAPAESDET